VQGDVRGRKNHVKKVCELLGGEGVPFRGEASGETAVGLGLDGHRSSICEGDCKFYRSGSSTLRSRFAFRMAKGVMICVAFVHCVLYAARRDGLVYL